MSEVWIRPALEVLPSLWEMSHLRALEAQAGTCFSWARGIFQLSGVSAWLHHFSGYHRGGLAACSHTPLKHPGTFTLKLKYLHFKFTGIFDRFRMRQAQVLLQETTVKHHSYTCAWQNTILIGFTCAGQELVEKWGFKWLCFLHAGVGCREGGGPWVRTHISPL